MGQAARNEQRKLTASYVNGIATAIFGIGSFTPIVVLAQTAAVTVNSTIIVIGCFAGSAALHWLARLVLRGLEE